MPFDDDVGGDVDAVRATRMRARTQTSPSGSASGPVRQRHRHHGDQHARSEQTTARDGFARRAGSRNPVVTAGRLDRVRPLKGAARHRLVGRQARDVAAQRPHRFVERRGPERLSSASRRRTGHRHPGLFWGLLPVVSDVEIEDRAAVRAESPIAVSEVQAYVYAAYVGRGHFADEAGDAATANRCRRRAADLRTAFNRDFWVDDTHGGYIVLGLDRDKRPIDAVASNMGHCPWSGILDRDKAEAVSARLLADDMFTGWGIGTMSS